MKRLLLFAAVLPAAGLAQTLPPIGAPGSMIPLAGSAFTDADGRPRGVSTATPLPTAGKQELAALVTANTPAQPVTLFGGTYVFNQLCTAYGSVTLRYRAADGTTMLPLITKITADASGGTAVQFGSGQVVDAALAGTTGCNVTLARMP